MEDWVEKGMKVAGWLSGWLAGWLDDGWKVSILVS